MNRTYKIIIQLYIKLYTFFKFRSSYRYLQFQIYTTGFFIFHISHLYLIYSFALSSMHAKSLQIIKGNPLTLRKHQNLSEVSIFSLKYVPLRVYCEGSVFKVLELILSSMLLWYPFDTQFSLFLFVINFRLWFVLVSGLILFFE